jgi:hypothetical protein
VILDIDKRISGSFLNWAIRSRFIWMGWDCGHNQPTCGIRPNPLLSTRRLPVGRVPLSLVQSYSAQLASKIQSMSWSLAVVGKQGKTADTRRGLIGNPATWSAQDVGRLPPWRTLNGRRRCVGTGERGPGCDEVNPALLCYHSFRPCLDGPNRASRITVKHGSGFVFIC